MKLEDIEMEIMELKKRVTVIEDIEEIKKVMYKYFYFVDYSMWDDLIDLFSENCSLELLDSGVYIGKEGVARQFKGRLGEKKQKIGRGYMGKITACDPIVDIMPDGKTATAGFDNLTYIAYPQLDRSEWGNGRYEVDFVKEEGKWKICSLHYQSRFRTPFDSKGWHVIPDIGTLQDDEFPPDKPTTLFTPYPDMFPAHRFPRPFQGPLKEKNNYEFTDS